MLQRSQGLQASLSRRLLLLSSSLSPLYLLIAFFSTPQALVGMCRGWGGIESPLLQITVPFQSQRLDGFWTSQNHILCGHKHNEAICLALCHLATCPHTLASIFVRWNAIPSMTRGVRAAASSAGPATVRGGALQGSGRDRRMLKLTGLNQSRMGKPHS